MPEEVCLRDGAEPPEVLYVSEGFKPAFDYNIKLELIAKGEWPPPKEPPKVDADGVPIAKVERIKYKAKQKMDDTKAAAQKKRTCSVHWRGAVSAAKGEGPTGRPGK